MDRSSFKPTREIIYHFKVATPRLLLQNFIDASMASQAVVADLNRNLFGGQVDYELRVVAPERGCFLAVIVVTLFGCGWIISKEIINFFETDIGKEVSKQISGKYPVEHVRHFFQRFQGKSKDSIALDGVSDRYISKEITRAKQSEIPEEQELLAITSDILGEAHNVILTTDYEELSSSGVTTENYEESFRKRDTFLRNCRKNKEIDGLGFDRTDTFPLDQSSFERLIIPPTSYKTSPKTNEIQKWIVETAEISVYSPNWKKKGRKWQASSDKHKDISFSIVDENFWYKVNQGSIYTTTRDNIRVQWAYPREKNKPSGDVRVIRVLEYNGRKISDALPDDMVAMLLGGEVDLDGQPKLLFR